MKRQTLIVLILSFLIVINSQIKVNAEKNIKTLRAPIAIEMVDKLNPVSTSVGTNVALIVPEDIIYKNSVLKKDTVLIGTVVKFKESKRYYKNGYFEILVNSINYPDRGLVNLKRNIDIKIYDPEIMNRKTKPAWLKTSEFIFFCSDNVIPGTSLPLYIYETFKWDKTLKNKSKAYKWGIILSKSTTVYYYADFFKKHKDPDYNQGDIINIKLKKNVSKEVFVSNI